MYSFTISKRNGTYRRVYAPNPKEKRELRLLLPNLMDISNVRDIHNVSHGFMNHKSPVTNAREHIGYTYTLSFDIKDFFDNVTVEKVKDVIDTYVYEKCFIYGVAKQGLPTSPAISNIIGSQIDNSIIEQFSLYLFPYKYTRYADDLTISFYDLKNRDIIEPIVKRALSSFGFTLNSKKTKLQSCRSGARVITGISVYNDEIKPTRKIKRKLRAAIHQGNKNQINGLSEWCKLKVPK